MPSGPHFETNPNPSPWTFNSDSLPLLLVTGKHPSYDSLSIALVCRTEEDRSSVTCPLADLSWLHFHLLLRIA